MSLYKSCKSFEILKLVDYFKDLNIDISHLCKEHADDVGNIYGEINNFNGKLIGFHCRSEKGVAMHRCPYTTILDSGKWGKMDFANSSFKNKQDHCIFSSIMRNDAEEIFNKDPTELISCRMTGSILRGDLRMIMLKGKTNLLEIKTNILRLLEISNRYTKVPHPHESHSTQESLQDDAVQ